MEKKWLKYKISAIIVFASGCLLDHLTTGYGLTLPYVSETNTAVLFLMQQGVWHVVEILLISAGVCSSYLTSLQKSDGLIKISTIGLFSGGLFRLLAGIHNLALIIIVLN